jgi:diguanylate cyclase (GGDEF)-like protein/PAS domain S-box-containing protein
MRHARDIVILSVIASCILGAADAIIDAFFFRTGASPVALLFGASLPEIHSRFFIIAGVLLFTAIIFKVIFNRDPARMAPGHIMGSRNIKDRPEKENRHFTLTDEGLRRSEIFLGTIFDSIHDPLSIVDNGYKIIEVNEAYSRLKGKAAEDLLGRSCYEALHGRNNICEECVVEKTFKSADPCAKEKRVTAPDGSEVWMEIYTYPVFDVNGKVSHVIEYARDITDRKMMEEEKKQLIKKLNHLSTTDSLTGLLNRRALNDLLDHEIDRANRYSSDLSLLICDIDRFKQINDTYGHTAGDQALRAISETFKSALRKADILGRWGGDEFMIILPETSLKGAKKLAEKIRSSVETTAVELPERKVVRLSTSIGVASCCAPAENIDTIVARADAALYASKQAGRNTVSVAAL